MSRLDDVLAQMAAGIVMVAPRDASHYNYPSTSSGPRSHSGGRLHAMTAHETAACAPVLLVADSAQPAAAAPGELLCRRQACYVRWFPARPEPATAITWRPEARQSPHWCPRCESLTRVDGCPAGNPAHHACAACGWCPDCPAQDRNA